MEFVLAVANCLPVVKTNHFVVITTEIFEYAWLEE
jgi:hypothetical protein